MQLCSYALGIVGVDYLLILIVLNGLYSSHCFKLRSTTCLYDLNNLTTLLPISMTYYLNQPRFIFIITVYITSHCWVQASVWIVFYKQYLAKCYLNRAFPNFANPLTPRCVVLPIRITSDTRRKCHSSSQYIPLRSYSHHDDSCFLTNRLFSRLFLTVFV